MILGLIQPKLFCDSAFSSAVYCCKSIKAFFAEETLIRRERRILVLVCEMNFHWTWCARAPFIQGTRFQLPAEAVRTCIKAVPSKQCILLCMRSSLREERINWAWDISCSTYCTAGRHWDTTAIQAVSEVLQHRRESVCASRCVWCSPQDFSRAPLWIST